jgi:hypothetical protein
MHKCLINNQLFNNLIHLVIQENNNFKILMSQYLNLITVLKKKLIIYYQTFYKMNHYDYSQNFLNY